MSSKTALLVVDMQNGVIAKTHSREQVIANIQSLIDKTRAQMVPVIWVQHSADEHPRMGNHIGIQTSTLRINRAKEIWRFLRGNEPEIGVRETWRESAGRAASVEKSAEIQL